MKYFKITQTGTKLNLIGDNTHDTFNLSDITTLADVLVTTLNTGLCTIGFGEIDASVRDEILRLVSKRLKGDK